MERERTPPIETIETNNNVEAMIEEMEREDKLKQSIDSSVKLNAADTAADGSLFGDTTKKDGPNLVESALDMHDQVNI